MTIGVWFKTVEQGGGTYPPADAYQFWSTNFLIGGDAAGSANDYGIGLSNGHIVWGIGVGGAVPLALQIVTQQIPITMVPGTM